MLGFPILSCKGMRPMMFQLSGFCYKGAKRGLGWNARGFRGRAQCDYTHRDYRGHYFHHIMLLQTIRSKPKGTWILCTDPRTWIHCTDPRTCKDMIPIPSSGYYYPLH